MLPHLILLFYLFLMQSFQVYSHIGKKGDAKDSR